jgi:hypothetical protein
MDNDLDLNDFGALPDGTSAANAGGSASMGGMPASALKKGFVTEGERTSAYDPQIDSEMTMGAPAEAGGVCGRPQGWAR